MNNAKNVYLFPPHKTLEVRAYSSLAEGSANPLPFHHILGEVYYPVVFAVFI